LKPEIGGFALEIVDLQFAVLAVVKLRSSADEWRPKRSPRQANRASFAAIALMATGNRPFPMILSPLIRLSGP